MLHTIAFYNQEAKPVPNAITESTDQLPEISDLKEEPEPKEEQKDGTLISVVPFSLHFRRQKRQENIHEQT